MVRFLKGHGFTELDVGGVGIILTSLLVRYKAVKSMLGMDM